MDNWTAHFICYTCDKRWSKLAPSDVKKLSEQIINKTCCPVCGTDNIEFIGHIDGTTIKHDQIYYDKITPWFVKLSRSFNK
jgi:hypothetical protein